MKHDARLDWCDVKCGTLFAHTGWSPLMFRSAVSLVLLLLAAAAPAQPLDASRAPAGQPAAPAVAAPARSAEAGRPFVRTYTPKEYGAPEQNWAIEQDDRGVIYVGNNSGVLEYDGASWRLIKMPNNTTARSLAKDGQGRIYVGAVGEFGYLAPDATGRDAIRLPARARACGEPRVRRRVAHAGHAGGRLLPVAAVSVRWSDGRLRVWKPQTPFLPRGRRGTARCTSASPRPDC